MWDCKYMRQTIRMNRKDVKRRGEGNFAVDLLTVVIFGLLALGLSWVV